MTQMSNTMGGRGERVVEGKEEREGEEEPKRWHLKSRMKVVFKNTRILTTQERTSSIKPRCDLKLPDRSFSSRNLSQYFRFQLP